MTSHNSHHWGHFDTMQPSQLFLSFLFMLSMARPNKRPYASGDGQRCWTLLDRYIPHKPINTVWKKVTESLKSDLLIVSSQITLILFVLPVSGHRVVTLLWGRQKDLPWPGSPPRMWWPTPCRGWDPLSGCPVTQVKADPGCMPQT